MDLVRSSQKNNSLFHSTIIKIIVNIASLTKNHDRHQRTCWKGHQYDLTSNTPSGHCTLL